MKKKIKVLVLLFIGIIALSSCKKSTEVISDQKENLTVNNKVVSPHFDLVIAEIINNKVVLSQDISTIIANLESLVNNGTQLGVDYDAYKVFQENGEYYLWAKDTDIPATTIVKLVLDNGVIYEYKFIDDQTRQASGSSCTCSGCASTGPDSSGDCEPRNGDNGWYCTSCSDGDCIKTVSDSILGVLTVSGVNY